MSPFRTALLAGLSLLIAGVLAAGRRARRSESQPRGRTMRKKPGASSRQSLAPQTVAGSKKRIPSAGPRKRTARARTTARKPARPRRST
jgi:hypothetical protein